MSMTIIDESLDVKKDLCKFSEKRSLFSFGPGMGQA